VIEANLQYGEVDPMLRVKTFFVGHIEGRKLSLRRSLGNERSLNLRLALLGLYLMSSESISVKATIFGRVDDVSRTKASTMALTPLKISTSESFVKSIFPNA
jgi:hypothetical protein